MISHLLIPYVVFIVTNIILLNYTNQSPKLTLGWRHCAHRTLLRIAHLRVVSVGHRVEVSLMVHVGHVGLLMLVLALVHHIVLEVRVVGVVELHILIHGGLVEQGLLRLRWGLRLFLLVHQGLEAQYWFIFRFLFRDRGSAASLSKFRKLVFLNNISSRINIVTDRHNRWLRLGRFIKINQRNVSLLDRDWLLFNYNFRCGLFNWLRRFFGRLGFGCLGGI